MRIGSRIAAVGMVALVGACAVAQSSGGQNRTMRRIPVVVDNTGSLSGSVTVYIVPQTGQRWNLGTVVGARVDTFYYNNPGFSGLYQLVADPVAGQPIYSERFALAENQAARWDLGINSVRVWDLAPPDDSLPDSTARPPR